MLGELTGVAFAHSDIANTYAIDDNSLNEQALCQAEIGP